jgi:hypothetical protein
MGAVSEKSNPRQQVGFVRRAKTSCRNPADFAGACSGGKFVVSRAGAGYDARVRAEKSEIPVQNHVIDVIPF